MKSILVPVDFGEGSLSALLAADGMADAVHAELVVLHVAAPGQADGAGKLDPHRTSSLAVGAKLRSALVVDDLEEQMATFLARAPTPRHARRVLFRVGAAPKVIVEAATELQSTLVVMATQGRSGLARLVLGSTTEEVIRAAPCPVLSIRPGLSLNWDPQS